MKVRGRVIKGNRIGRELGYPTANIEIGGSFVAENGVYTARAVIAGHVYDGMANLGVKPTFSDGDGDREKSGRLLELHLFDFEGDLYGRELEVELLHFIRPEQKFSSAEELTAQIAKDVPVAKRALERAAATSAATEETTRSTTVCDAKGRSVENSESLTFERITDTGHPLFEEAWNLYIKSFPPEERRQLRTQRKIMTDAPYRFELMTNGGALVGIMLWWDFADMRYVEHFATLPRLRGRGYGARALADFTARSAVPVVLEVELPTAELSRRRVEFYRRQGFVQSDRPYTHPPYKRGGERVPLMLMSHPAAITEAQFESFLDTHHPVIHRFAM